MANNLNRVMLIGSLGADPETKTFSNGGRICNLRIATSEAWKDRATGQKKERTEWHSVSVTVEHTIRFCEDYLRKGSKVYIEGQLQTRKWQDQNGNDRYSTEIVVRPYGGQVMSLDRRGGGAQGGGNQAGGNSSGGSDWGRTSDSGGGGFDDGFDDDEIPF